MTRFLAQTEAAARPAPDRRRGLRQILAEDFFYAPGATVWTLVLVVLLGLAAWTLFDWAVLNAVFGPTGTLDASQACRAEGAEGACWAVIGDKVRLILFGLYPFDLQWRPGLACLLMIALYALSVQKALWRPALGVIWALVLAAVLVLMRGGVAGLAPVGDDQWGGLPVTLILSTFGLGLAFPVAIALALARQQRRFPMLQAASVGLIEFARAVPLVVVLFMASVMMPLFLPESWQVSKLLRVLIAFTLFGAAYLAEVIRGGLQAIPSGQYEAASALSLTYAQTMRDVILPQALRIVIPGIVNVFIGFFKATAIVVVVGIFDLMTAAKRAVADPLWQGFGIEVYLFAGLIYFVFCFSLSRFSARLERDLARDRS
ncbi:amino acid ABC transporter permease [Pararhodobacter aggregans]|uniref:Amino acid ABC transporter permease n=1 Tax=Pararhodobacter aggregans TaxID=404875 RepID=A0A2T7UK71_9RHOB|nr:amino acid ABC transporter permease [Pararhodobacter aggregans]PTX03241.1 amino acid ABC transporter membrane protein 2 (PAAT family) [Pararhodobacter aggregans]PVE45080.1 amino acid ABC transporter permease [Pararhodobacter aggregans]